MRAGENKRAHHVLLDLFNLVEPTPDQTKLIAKAANSAGDVADSYYYMSEFYIMNGELGRSSNELTLALTSAESESDSARTIQRAARGSAVRDGERQTQKKTC